MGILGGTRLAGRDVRRRTVTASLIGGVDIDLTDVKIPDGAGLRITKPSLIGGGCICRA